MNKCLSLYKPQKGEGFSPKALKMLFDGKNISSHLDFDIPTLVHSSELEQSIKQISISGVQIKYSLKLLDKKLVISNTGGQYLLKPIPLGRLQNLELVPENEHLTMQIASQVFGIETAANTLIYFKNGEVAYLVKRFDIKKDGRKWLQEDFAQLKEVSSQKNGENYKYEGSYEAIAQLIKRYCAAWPIELEKFYKILIFNYLISNGDAHLKNFSIVETSFGDFRLSPAYDLLCTYIHTPFELAMALDLFEDGFFTDSYNLLGYYSYADFYLFAQKIGMKESRIKKILSDFVGKTSLVQQMIANSFLPNHVKQMYEEQFLRRIRGLSYRLPT